MAKGKFEEWLEEDKLLLLQSWARNGLTEDQIAHNMGIAYSTLKVWKGKYPAISAALKKGKEVIDFEVENSLLKRALGFTYDEVTSERMDNGEIGVTKIVTKHVLPDTTAQIFWLRNRKGNAWSNKDAIEAEKAKASTELTRAKLSLIKGIEHDTSLMQTLLDVLKGDDDGQED